MKEIEKHGYTVVPLLKEQEVSALREVYRNVVDETAVGFHCTMFNSDKNHRKAVDAAIRNVVGSAVAEKFPDYRILYGNFMVKPV